jgi:hypothetical protein
LKKEVDNHNHTTATARGVLVAGLVLDFECLTVSNFCSMVSAAVRLIVSARGAGEQWLCRSKTWSAVAWSLDRQPTSSSFNILVWRYGYDLRQHGK